MLIKSLCPSRRKLFGFVVAIFLTLALHTNVSLAARNQTFGVVALTNVASIGILDGDTQTVTAPLLTGELGAASAGDVLDVVISPDGNTTLVSNFADSTVFFIDTSDPDAPEVIGSVVLSFFPEDMDMTPDGNYVLVSDGGPATKIAVLNVESRTLVEEFNDPTLANQAVAVTPDGETVLTANTDKGTINAFTLSESGHLTYVASTDVSNGNKLFPVNLTISPDGETAIVASGTALAANMAFPVLTITGPGQITLSDMVTPSLSLIAAQSVVFNLAGTKAYLNCEQEGVAPNVVVVLNVSASGVVTDSGTSIEVDFANTDMLYGVETMALDNVGTYLYVSNFGTTAGKTYVQVVDVATNTVVKTITFDTDSVPTGIAFWISEGQFEDGDSGSDYNLKLSGISGISVRDADSEIDPHTKNSDKEIKVIVTGRNRPTVSFGLIDEDNKDVEVNKYDIQIQYTDVLGRRLNSYKTWVKGIKHKTPTHPESYTSDGFKIKYTGNTKDRVEVKPITKELKEGTYYVRVKAYDNADNTVNSKEAKLLIGTGSTGDLTTAGDLTITTLGAITYDSKYKYYYYNSNLLTIKGTANPNKQVDLYQNGAKLTQVTAESDGKYTINYALENGVYNLKLVQDQDSIPFTLNIDNTSQSFPANLSTENI